MRLVTQGLINKLHPELIPIWVCLLEIQHRFWSFERNSRVEISYGSTQRYIELHEAPLYVYRALANRHGYMLLDELITMAR